MEPSLVFTAMSKHLYYYRQQVSRFVVGRGHFPVNPFMNSGYYLGENITKPCDDKTINGIREGNNRLVAACDELWVFGKISDGVLREILIANAVVIPVRYFDTSTGYGFMEMYEEDASFEEYMPEDEKKCLHTWESISGGWCMQCAKCGECEVDENLAESGQIPKWLIEKIKDGEFEDKTLDQFPLTEFLLENNNGKKFSDAKLYNYSLLRYTPDIEFGPQYISSNGYKCPSCGWLPHPKSSDLKTLRKMRDTMGFRISKPMNTSNHKMGSWPTGWVEYWSCPRCKTDFCYDNRRYYT